MASGLDSGLRDLGSRPGWADCYVLGQDIVLSHAFPLSTQAYKRIPANLMLERGGVGVGVTLWWPASHPSGSRNSLSHLMLMKPNLRGRTLNYRSRTVAKGLLKTSFCGKWFRVSFYVKWLILHWRTPGFKKYIVEHAKLVPVWNHLKLGGNKKECQYSCWYNLMCAITGCMKRRKHYWRKPENKSDYYAITLPLHVYVL